METSQQKLLEEIRARVEAASPTPWSKETHFGKTTIIANDKYFVTRMLDSGPQEKKDSDFIAYAPTDIKALLQIIEKQREALEFYAQGKHTFKDYLGIDCPYCEEKDIDQTIGKTDLVRDIGETAKVALNFIPAKAGRGE